MIYVVYITVSDQSISEGSIAMLGKVTKNEIQVMRCFAIIMVIFHHTINNLPDSIGGGYLLRIASSDVALFFLISGFLFEKNFDKYENSKKDFFKKKTKHLIVPYLFWSLLLYSGGWIIHEVIEGQISNLLINLGFKKLTWTQIIVNIILFEDYYVEHLWFLYVLFMFFAVNLLAGRKLNKAWIAVLIILVGGIINKYLGLPHLAWKFLKHYSDFLVGRIAFSVIEGKAENIKALSNKKTVIFVVVLTFLAFVSNTALDNINSIFIRIFNPILQHLFWWSFGFCCYMLACWITNKKLSKGIVLIGDYSYDIYLMHSPYVVPVVAFISYKITNLWTASLIITIVCGIAIPILISKFIVRKSRILRLIALGSE